MWYASETVSKLDSVSLERVTRSYGTTVALRDVTTKFSARALTLVMGANGSGKSTLLGVLSTSLRPTSGKVNWGTLGNDPEIVRKHIGWLGHDAQVYPDLSGVENLSFYAQVYNVPKDRVAKTMERVGIGSFGNRAVRTYSRGQRQRVALAKAILHEPTILLLDEPTTGLDKDGIGQLINTLKQEVDRGAVVVMVTHEETIRTSLDCNLLRLDRGRVQPNS